MRPDARSLLAAGMPRRPAKEGERLELDFPFRAHPVWRTRIENQKKRKEQKKMNAKNTKQATATPRAKIEWREYAARTGKIYAIYARIDGEWKNGAAIAPDTVQPYYQGRLALARAQRDIAALADVAKIEIRDAQRTAAEEARLAIEADAAARREERTIAEIATALNPAAYLDKATSAANYAAARAILTAHTRTAKAAAKYGAALPDAMRRAAAKAAKERARAEAAAKAAAKAFAEEVAAAAKERAAMEARREEVAAAKAAAKAAK